MRKAKNLESLNNELYVVKFQSYILGGGMDGTGYYDEVANICVPDSDPKPSGNLPQASKAKQIESKG